MKFLAKHIVILAALLAGAAHAQEDVGLVNQLAGNVSYQSQGSAPAKASAFMKVRRGDAFTLAGGAQLRLVYFEGGRQESWSGPASFRAGAQASDAVSGQPASVTTLPGVVHQKIAQMPQLLQVARMGRTGGVAVRGIVSQRLTPQQQQEVATARSTYARLRADSSADDITPELYLFSTLQEYSQYDAMLPVAQEMAKRQPQSSEVRELLEWVKTKAK